MTPGESFLLAFMIIFLLAAFVVILLILIGVLFGPSSGGGGPAPAPPVTGPNTGNPPSSCNPSMISDDNNCCVTGIVCNTAALQFCTNGACQCVTGSTLCPDAGFGGSPACVFLPVDIRNCGACGNACQNGETCCNGTCVNVLAPSATGSCGKCGNVCTGANPTCCNGFCKDLSTDLQNCGACLHACADNQLCCGGSCTGPDNNQNCGACGHACVGATICRNGSCVPGCPSGFLTCGSQCVDPLTDNQNCGACAAICPAHSYCQGGSCTPNVCTVPGQVFCPSLGFCVSLSNNADNCGECGLRCPNGPCVNGFCSCVGTTDCPSAYTCQVGTVQTQTVQPSGATGGVETASTMGSCAAPPCLPGQTFCVQVQNCADLTIQPNSCGQCGTVCKSGICNSGLCTCPGGDSDCPAGYVCAAGTCVLR